VRPGEIVEALPFVELGVEELGVVDDLAGEEPIEVFVVDAMRPLDLTVQSRCRWYWAADIPARARPQDREARAQSESPDFALSRLEAPARPTLLPRLVVLVL